ncbi:MAG: MIP/aquaporin family protein [Nitrosopumilaceae archaeon]
MKLINKLYSNQKKFIAEVVGTFVIVVLATGSVVLDAKFQGSLGLPFIAFAPFVGVSLMVYAFGKISMAHFNPAVTIGFLITKHIPRNLLPVYLIAQVVGALLGSLFVKYVIGTEANLGANAPNLSFSLPLIFSVEVLATSLLMGVVLVVVYTKGLRNFSGIAIGGMVGLDIFFLSFISGASMNPVRSLTPAIFSGMVDDLWLYWSATFVGSSIVAFIYRNKFSKSKFTS